MVTLECEKGTLLLSSASLVQDCSLYYSYISATTKHQVPINEKVKICTPKPLQCRVIASDYTGEDYQLKLITEAQYAVVFSFTKPIVGVYSAGDLLSKLGIKQALKNATQATQWILPTLSFTDLIDNLNHYTVVQGGRCPHFYLDSDGYVKMVDFKLSWEAKETIPIRGNLVSDRCSNEWNFITRGNAIINYSSVTELKREEIKLSETEPQQLVECSFTDYNESFSKRYFSTEYYTYYYTARKLSYSDVLTAPHYLGQKVYNSLFYGIVISVEIPIQISDEKSRPKVTIACPR